MNSPVYCLEEWERKTGISLISDKYLRQDVKTEGIVTDLMFCYLKIIIEGRLQSKLS